LVKETSTYFNNIYEMILLCYFELSFKSDNVGAPSIELEDLFFKLSCFLI